MPYRAPAQESSFGAISQRQTHNRSIPNSEHYQTTPRPVLSAPPSRTNSACASVPGLPQAAKSVPECHIGLRSLKGMEGLQVAEHGGAMVEFDVGGDSGGIGSRFLQGNRFALDPMTPGGGAFARHQRGSPSARPGPSPMPPELSVEGSISSHDTLLSIGRSHSRNAAELKALLGNANARLKPNAVMLPPTDRRTQHPKATRGQTVSLEQAKPRARVEIDIVLESNTFVQGSYMRGHIKVRVRKRAKKEAPIFLTEGKLRVVGYESVPNEDDTYTFYQCTASLSAVTDASQSLYDTPLAPDGFAQAVEGVHVLPFAMELPLDSCVGNAKGVLSLSSGVQVRYVAMVSIKVRDSGTGKRSIAHFYRNCEIWPRLDPLSVLSIASRPLQASVAKSFSLLSNHELKANLTAQLHRLHWIAGQRCHVKILVRNGTRKLVRSCILTLVRTTTVFRPKPTLEVGGGDNLYSDPDACQTSTIHRAVVDSSLEMGQKGAKGYASAKGWWTGVRPGQELEFSHFILLPTDALSVTRGRLLEVEYSIRVALSAGPLTSDICVTLPIRIVNFISLDPPPSAALLSTNGAYFRSVQRQTSLSSATSDSRWGTLDSNAPSGVMHFQDGPPPPISRSNQSLFSEESSTTSSMQSLIPLAVTTQGRLRIANPDRSKLELTRATSDASVYSTDSAVHVPSTSLYLSSISGFGAMESSDKERTVTRKGNSGGRTNLDNLLVDSDDRSDADAVLQSVLRDLRQANHGYPHYRHTSPKDEDACYAGPSEGSYEAYALTADDDSGPASSVQRARRISDMSQTCHGVHHSSGELLDQEQTPRVSYTQIRSDHIQIPPKLQPGIRSSDFLRDKRPPIPPRSSQRPLSIHASAGKPDKNSLRGPRNHHDASRYLPLSKTLIAPVLSTNDVSASLAYARQPPAQRSARQFKERGDFDPSVKLRIAELEDRVREIAIETS